MTVEEYRKLNQKVTTKKKGSSKKVISADKAPTLGAGFDLVQVDVKFADTWESHYIPSWNTTMIDYWRNYKGPA